MKFETLNSSRRKNIIIGALILIVVILTLSLMGSHAKYKTTQNIKLAEGKISYKVPDLNVVAMYQESDTGYQEISNVPTGGYVINEEKSYCGQSDGKGNIIKDNNVSIEYKNNVINFYNITKKSTKCYLYFYKEKTPINIQEMLAAHQVMLRTDFEEVLTANTTGYMYNAPDNDGTSYYFAGNPTDNWVKFAGFYWRIIRINGNGSLRLIYSGSEITGPSNQGTNTQIGTGAFNSNYNDNMYVGYMYENGVVHGNVNNSTIKIILENWYTNNILNKGFDSYINSDVGFCNERTFTAGSGKGTDSTHYTVYDRLYSKKSPSLICSSSDIFRTTIGLITADEISYAGGVYGKSNTNYYLYSNSNYWTMSPDSFHSNYAYVTFVDNSGLLDSSHVDSSYGIRPVINLKANITFSSGNGTANNPYVVN